MSIDGENYIFKIILDEEKEIVINYDISIKNGEYQLIYINPDNSEKILQENTSVKESKRQLLHIGENKIKISADNAEFKSIDILIDGLEETDFKDN